MKGGGEEGRRGRAVLARLRSGRRSAGMQWTLMAWFSVISLFACVTIGVMTYEMRARGIRSALFENLELLRDSAVALVNRWFEHGRADVEAWASRQSLIELCASSLAGTVPADATVRAVLEEPLEIFDLEEVILFAPDGRLLAAASSHPDPRRRLALALVREVAESGSSRSSDVQRGERGELMLVFAAPVRRSHEGELQGVLAFFYDPAPIFDELRRFASLGETGEVVLVNRDRVVQKPLIHRDGAVGRLAIGAEPARRGAAGQHGRIAANDYRGEPVMAAYGYVPEAGWGLVVKQDMAEIDAPVLSMGRQVGLVALLVLACSLLAALFVARRFGRITADISSAAQRVAAGQLDARATPAGAAELQDIARALNEMVDTLAGRSRTQALLTELFAAASRHNSATALLDDVLPRVMALMGAAAGSVYTEGEGGILVRRLVQGLPEGRLPETLTLTPPSSLMSQAARERRAIVTSDVVEAHALTVVTPAGEAVPRALICVPLLREERALGVIGLASLERFDEESLRVAEALMSGLGPALAAAIASERSEQLAERLALGNKELQAVNTELTKQRAELQEQAVELEHQQRELERANRLKTEFLSNMSHELRTPLNNILALAQLMLAQDQGRGERENGHLAVIERNGRQLLRLINDILDLSRIEAGRMDLELTSFSPEAPALEALEGVRQLALDKGLVLERALEPGLPPLESDFDKIRRVLLNLLGNAIKFTEAGGVSLGLSASGDEVVYSVRDTGIGLSAEELGHIFEAFRQADGSTTRRYGGTGLGLTISRTMARLLGGDVTVTSRPGEGSTFSLRLPRSAPSARGQRWSEGDSLRRRTPPAGLPAGKQVLLVEDNEVAVLQIRTVLEEAGLAVQVCTGGKEAIAAMEDFVPDAIILDLMMPGVDGFEVLERMRSRAATREVPVLVLTAKEVTAEERARLSSNNLQQLVRKGSLDREELLERVSRLLSGEEQPAATQARRRPRASAAPLLVVEDNADNLHTLCAILDKAGLRYRVARDGVEALEAARQELPSLILMDLHLPRLSGEEAVRRLRRDPATAAVPVLAVTARVLPEERKAALAAGFDDLLAKPLEPAAVAATVRRWLEGGGDL